MRQCLFATDLHGDQAKYRLLFAEIANKRPSAVFLGGDLLPHGEVYGAAGGWDSAGDGADGFIRTVLAPGLADLRDDLGSAYPPIYAVLGNDDPGSAVAHLQDVEDRRLLHYVHMRRVVWGSYLVFGYACVPPTPFVWKDWERYDVSRYVDPGCVSPEDGQRSLPHTPEDVRYGTIARDLRTLTEHDDLDRAIFVFHSPPYGTPLDRAALDGRTFDGVPLDPHVGSIAIARFIEERQPRVTLHGHVHESVRLTGTWKHRIGRTFAFGGAHDGPELALIHFDPERPENAERILLEPGS